MEVRRNEGVVLAGGRPPIQYIDYDRDKATMSQKVEMIESELLEPLSPSPHRDRARRRGRGIPRQRRMRDNRGTPGSSGDDDDDASETSKKSEQYCSKLNFGPVQKEEKPRSSQSGIIVSLD